MAFDPSRYSSFSYRDAVWMAERYEARFHYALEGDGFDDVVFTERVQFTPARTPADQKSLQGLLVVLGAVLGLSYFKAAAPPVYRVEVPGLTDAACTYLDLVIRHGMAEFAYRNGLSGPLDVDIQRTAPAGSEFPRESWRLPDGDPIVPIGGGKDSVVTVELLHRARLHPIQFAVNANPLIRRVAHLSGHALISAKRTLDPLLLQLNGEGALNGHVPVTAMNSLIALCQAQILDSGPVVMSIEATASEPTLEVDGWAINHQWSKSLEAEKALRQMIGPQAGLLPESYFSLLRPFSELRIAGEYAHHTQYHRVATSCNRAFRLDAGDVGWCADCDKCRFVFLLLARYLTPWALEEVFGANLLDDISQVSGYEELVGLARHRPFECVGSEAEAIVALAGVASRSQWADTAVVAHFRGVIDDLDTPPDALRQSVSVAGESLSMPENFEEAQRALR